MDEADDIERRVKMNCGDGHECSLCGIVSDLKETTFAKQRQQTPAHYIFRGGRSRNTTRKAASAKVQVIGRVARDALICLISGVNGNR